MHHLLNVSQSDGTTIDIADIVNDNNFKSFEYKAKLLGNTDADEYNRVLKKNETFAMPLKYLRNFWRSFEMPLINCKVESKLKWKKYNVLAAAGADIQMLILIILFSLSKTPKNIFLL